ncbi:MAG: hypothetical protein JXQ27_09860 [Acidobacteria bacterium]|nr:hypothetical protein [Acidobacteriota bacterium]
MIWVFGAALGLLAVWLAVNQLDTTPSAGESDLAAPRPAALSPENGFCRLVTLCAEPDEDVTGPAFVEWIRQLNDPQTMARDDYPELFHTHWPGTRTFEDLQEILGAEDDFYGACLRQAEPMRERIETYGYILDRYAWMLQAETVEDTTYPHYQAPVLSLLNTRLFSRLYLAEAILVARDVDPERAADMLLDHIRFHRLLVRNARMLIHNLAGLACLADSLRVLAVFMNQPGRTADVCSHVANRLPPLQLADIYLENLWWGEYNYSRNSIMDGSVYDYDPFGEGDFPFNVFKYLTLQRNRTLGYLDDSLAQVRTEFPHPPYEGHEWTPRLHTTGGFWWLNNAAGKIIHDFCLPSMKSFYSLLYEMMATHDRVRLAAQAYVHFGTGTTATDVQAYLDSEGSVDPFSGQPYRFDGEERVLYSVGPRRPADRGIVTRFIPETAIRVPCVLPAP